MSIYKNYDQEALDRQYNNRAAVPEFPRFVEEWEKRSEEVRARFTVFEDLPYGDHERERLDIFPASQPHAPIQIFYHGGYWQAMDKMVNHFIAEGFIHYDVTTVFVNYPLAPHASMDDIIASCRRSVVWLYLHAGEYNGDPGQIFLSGHSAGGHIVAMLMSCKWREYDEGLIDDIIKGGCAVSGLFDLRPIQLCYLNDVLGLDSAMSLRNSPVHMSPSHMAPLILAVGGAESSEYHAQSNDFSAAWTSLGISVTEIPCEGHNHFSILNQMADKASSLHESIRKQMSL